MTPKSSKILSLKKIQKQRVKEIKELKKRMWKHLIWITIIIGGFVLFCLDDSYKLFGNVTNFILLNFSILLLISVCYYLYVRQQEIKKTKEIKSIKIKLYNLMKLEDE